MVCDGKPSLESLQIEFFISYYGLNEPTHILSHSLSCTDNTFMSQPNLVTHSGVHSSLHTNFHHEIAFAKFDHRIEYRSPYERLVWNYSQADTILIQCAINECNWENEFSDIDMIKS